MRWMLHQLILTRNEIRLEITIPHLTILLIGYIFTHAIVMMYRRATNAEKLLLKRLKSNRDRYRYLHTKNAHKGRYRNCAACETIQAQYQPEWPLTAPAP